MTYWKRIDSKGNITTVESYDHNLDVIGAIEITESEYQAFIDSLPKPEVINYRDLYSKAMTTNAKLDILAQSIGLKQ